MKTALLVSILLSATLSARGQSDERDSPNLRKYAEEARKGAEQGDTKRQTNLAFYYQMGLGVKQDDTEAAKWYRRAAEKGYKPALDQLFGMCSNHKTTSEECAYVVNSLRPLAEQGDSVAQYDLGELLKEGLGCPLDYVGAATYYRMSAEQGNWHGQMGLGLLYENGKGVPEDFVLAHMWLNLASAASPVDGLAPMQEPLAKHRDFLASKMTRDEIAEAQRLAREWKPTQSK